MNHLIRFLRHINRISHELETEPDWAELEQISNALVQRELHTAFGLLNSVAAESVYLSFAHRLLMVRYHTLIGNLESAQSLIHGYTSDVLRTLPLADAAWRHRTGLVERLAGNLHAAVSLCIEAEQLYTSVAMEYDAALVRADLGLALIMRGDTSAGIEALVAALPIIKEQGTEVQVNAMMANLASARFKSGDYRGAETDFREILGKPPFHTPSSETAALLQNLAIISKAQGRLQESLHLYRSALDCAQPGTNKLQYLRLLNGRADVEYRLENISGFLETAQQLQQLVSEVGIVPPPVAVELSVVWFRKHAVEGRINEALQHAAHGRHIAREHRLWEELDQLLSAMLEFSLDMETQMGILNDLAELRSERLQSVHAMVTTLLDIRSAYERERAELNRQRQIKNINIIVETENRIEQQIARDLHDSVGQQLTVLERFLQRAATDGTPSADKMAEMASLATESANDVRRISHLLAAANVTGLTLPTVLAELVHRLHMADPTLTAQLYINGASEFLPDATARAFYRCVQTIVQNTLRHAQARTLEIHLTTMAHEAICMVTDDGVGFDTGEIGKGLGLQSVAARMEAIGGEVHVDTSIGNGTVVVLRTELNVR